MSQFVMWYDSREGGAPVVNNAPASLIGALDACLVTGFNNKTISSLVVASGVATATCAAHGFMGRYSQDVEISGATPAALNERFQPTVVNANTFTFLAPNVSDQTATGTISVKRPSLGWTKLFSSADAAIYRRNDPQSTSLLLRVSEPVGATSARVLMLESATGINTFIDQSPTQAQVAGGQFWYKSNNNASAKPWQLIGDGRRFYFFVDPVDATAYPRASLSQERPYGYAFGDFTSLKQGDAYNCMVLGMDRDVVGTGFSTSNDILVGGSGINGTTAPAFVLARAADQTAKSVFALSSTPNGSYSGSDTRTPYPSSVDGGMVLQTSIPIFQVAGTVRECRGFMPGTLHVSPNQPLAHTTVVSPVVNLQGRSIIMMAYFRPASNSAQIAIDATGPWG